MIWDKRPKENEFQYRIRLMKYGVCLVALGLLLQIVAIILRHHGI